MLTFTSSLDGNHVTVDENTLKQHNSDIQSAILPFSIDEIEECLSDIKSEKFYIQSEIAKCLGIELREQDYMEKWLKEGKENNHYLDYLSDLNPSPVWYALEILPRDGNTLLTIAGMISCVHGREVKLKNLRWDYIAYICHYYKTDENVVTMSTILSGEPRLIKLFSLHGTTSAQKVWEMMLTESIATAKNPSKVGSTFSSLDLSLRCSDYFGSDVTSGLDDIITNIENDLDSHVEGHKCGFDLDFLYERFTIVILYLARISKLKQRHRVLCHAGYGKLMGLGYKKIQLFIDNSDVTPISLKWSTIDVSPIGIVKWMNIEKSIDQYSLPRSMMEELAVVLLNHAIEADDNNDVITWSPQPVLKNVVKVGKYVDNL